MSELVEVDPKKVRQDLDLLLALLARELIVVLEASLQGLDIKRPQEPDAGKK